MDKDFILEFFGVELLGYDSVDHNDEGIQYNEVSFMIISLKKYDGLYIEVKHNWDLVVWGERGEVIDEFSIIDNDEFRQKLYEKHPLIKAEC